MTVDEIFNKVISHMEEGVAFHNEMAKVYDFLGLWGFAKCHVSHCLEEKKGMLCLQHYYACHYFKMIQLESLSAPELIPDTWYKYTTFAVDNATRKNAVKDLMTKWVAWEEETKKLYQTMRQELTTIGEIDAALQLDCYIQDVSKELYHAQKKLIALDTQGYDIQIVTEMSKKMSEKYKKKIGW